MSNIIKAGRVKKGVPELKINLELGQLVIKPKEARLSFEGGMTVACEIWLNNEMLERATIPIERLTNFLDEIRTVVQQCQFPQKTVPVGKPAAEEQIEEAFKRG